MSAARITPGWFSVSEAAIYSGFSVPSIRQFMQQGLPYSQVKISPDSPREMVRIKRDHIDAWISGQLTPAGKV